MSRTADQIEEKVKAGERPRQPRTAWSCSCRRICCALARWRTWCASGLHGDRTFFNVNMRFEATNVREASCRFCAFQKLEEGMPGAHTTTHEKAWAELRDFLTPSSPSCTW